MELSTTDVTPSLSGIQTFVPHLVTPLAPSVMGGGDRVRFSTPATVPQARGRGRSPLPPSTPHWRGPRPLRRASPAPRPLWQYATPPRQQRGGLKVRTPASSASHTRLEANDGLRVPQLAPFSSVLPSNEEGHGELQTADAVDLTLEHSSSVTVETPEPAVPSLDPEPEDLSQEYRFEFTPEPSFGNGFLASCNLPSFDPERPTFTPFDILMRLGYVFGSGVTKSELKRVFRKCRLCDNLLYAERRSQHRCEGDAIYTREEDFDLVQALVTMEEHAGIRPADLTRLLLKCKHCRRFCITTMSRFHRCPHREVITVTF